jgi:hypothetical protein
MITGVVKSDEGRIRLKVKGLRGRQQEVKAVIDTGYTASLTLPAAGSSQAEDSPGEGGDDPTQA